MSIHPKVSDKTLKEKLERSHSTEPTRAPAKQAVIFDHEAFLSPEHTLNPKNPFYETVSRMDLDSRQLYYRLANPEPYKKEQNSAAILSLDANESAQFEALRSYIAHETHLLCSHGESMASENPLRCDSTDYAKQFKSILSEKWNSWPAPSPVQQESTIAPPELRKHVNAQKNMLQNMAPPSSQDDSGAENEHFSAVFIMEANLDSARSAATTESQTAADDLNAGAHEWAQTELIAGQPALPL